MVNFEIKEHLSNPDAEDHDFVRMPFFEFTRIFKWLGCSDASTYFFPCKSILFLFFDLLDLILSFFFFPSSFHSFLAMVSLVSRIANLQFSLCESTVEFLTHGKKELQILACVCHSHFN